MDVLYQERLRRGVIVTEDEFIIFTHDETGREVEFAITNIENFLNSQENLPEFIKEMEKKVGFQRDLKYGIENKILNCNDRNTGEDISEREAEYLENAIFNNLKVIRKAREFLGMSPEPEIGKSDLKSSFLKSKAGMN